MITVEINESTPTNMLRAIRAACNELLGETVELRLPTAAVESLQAFADQEQDIERELNAAHEEAAREFASEAPEPQPAEELDSAGQPWNAELHSSSRAKIADGTWKKKRGAGKTEATIEAGGANVPLESIGLPIPPVPPAPAAPTATAEPIMPKIFALITSQIVTINQAVEAAQAEGFADLGANGLGGAPVEKQLAVLRKLEGA